MDKQLAASILRQYEIKVTPQRVTILSYLIGNKTHPTVEEMHKKVNKLEPSLSLATVYNTFLLFKEKGILQEINSFSSKAHYDPDTSAHLHLVCQNCQKVYDLEDRSLVRALVQKDYYKKHSISRVQICFQGYCDNCNS